MKRHKKVIGVRVPKNFEESHCVALAASDEPFVISELKREERLMVGYAGAMGMRDFAWSKFYPKAIAGKFPGSETFWRLEHIVPTKLKTNPDAELVAMIYLASIGEQL